MRRSVILGALAGGCIAAVMAIVAVLLSGPAGEWGGAGNATARREAAVGVLTPLRDPPGDAAVLPPSSPPRQPGPGAVAAGDSGAPSDPGMLAALQPGAPVPQRPDAAAGASDRAAPGAGSPGPASSGKFGPAASDDAASADADAPVFDLVRVDSEGDAVIAGRAEPGTSVEILLDDRKVSTAIAGPDGTFVAVLSLGTSVEPRSLSLRTDLPGEPGDMPRSAALGDGGGGGAAPPRVVESRAVVLLPTEAPGQGPLVVMPAHDGVTLLRPDRGPVEGVMLDSVSYGDGGSAVAAGRAPEGGVIRGYADGRFVGDARVGEDGRWTLALPRDVAEDTALLRFDNIDPGGEVDSRVETRFAYDRDGAAQEVRARRIVVASGDSLWRIAETAYGEGARYSVIFGANAELIRDPDLIYPDQVFTLPELVPVE